MELKTFDFDGEEENKPVETKTIEEPNYSFKSDESEDANFRLKYYTINKHFSLKRVFEELDIRYKGTNMYCPFHMDAMTGKMSATYHKDTDLMYCFSESKIYSAYHALKLLLGKNMDEMFKIAWAHLSSDDREALMREYGGDEDVKKDYTHPIWQNLRGVLYQFKAGNVSIRQHKNALYKVLNMMYDKDQEDKQKMIESL